MAKKRVWTNKKFPGKTFEGYFRRHDGDREFILKRPGLKREISFESPESAKKLGWIAK